MARNQFDVVNFTKQYKGELHEFFLDLKRWKKFKTRHNLPWTKVRFAPASHAGIPKQRGIYVFTVELSPSKLPLHGYIMYVGITGEIGEADLHQRYGQYQREVSFRQGCVRGVPTYFWGE